MLETQKILEIEEMEKMLGLHGDAIGVKKNQKNSTNPKKKPKNSREYFFLQVGDIFKLVNSAADIVSLVFRRAHVKIGSCKNTVGVRKSWTSFLSFRKFQHHVSSQLSILT